MRVRHEGVLRVLTMCGLLALSTAAVSADTQRGSTVRLATTTSTENSGLLHDLLPRFRAASGYQVHVIAVGTGKALRMGRDGDVDVVLVHAPAAERQFVEAGFGVQRLPVMYNDFVLVGPPHDPAGVARAGSVVAAFKRVAHSHSLFISRGDDSGTHKKEIGLWRQTGLMPDPEWYREAGQGMGKVLQMAAELQAYTLTDRGTWLAFRDTLQLKIAYQGHEDLFNPYAIIQVSPARFGDLNHAGARALIEWLRGAAGQRAIAAYRKSGEPLFTPSASVVAVR